MRICCFCILCPIWSLRLTRTYYWTWETRGKGGKGTCIDARLWPATTWRRVCITCHEGDGRSKWSQYTHRHGHNPERGTQSGRCAAYVIWYSPMSLSPLLFVMPKRSVFHNQKRKMVLGGLLVPTKKGIVARSMNILLLSRLTCSFYEHSAKKWKLTYVISSQLT